MKKLLLILLLAGCGTTTVVDRVEVPVPYWEKPKNIKELPDRAPLESQRISPEEAKEDTRAAFQALAEDVRALIEENEHIRFLYEELVKRITEEAIEEETP